MERSGAFRFSNIPALPSPEAFALLRLRASASRPRSAEHLLKSLGELAMTGPPRRSPAGLSGDLLGAGRGAELEQQTVRLARRLLPTGFVAGQLSELSPLEQEEWVRALKEYRLLR
jgi:hypothetical protein